MRNSLPAVRPSRSFNRPGPRSSVVHFTSDRTGWWNLYRWDGAKVDALAPMQAECGAAQWVFGLSTYAFCDDRRIALWARREGEWELFVLDASGSLTRIDVPETEFGLHVSASGDDLLYEAGGPDAPLGVIRHNLATGARRAVQLESDDMAIEETVLSTAAAHDIPRVRRRDGARLVLSAAQ